MILTASPLGFLSEVYATLDGLLFDGHARQRQYHDYWSEISLSLMRTEEREIQIPRYLKRQKGHLGSDSR